jgi:hypothetical protein
MDKWLDEINGEELEWVNERTLLLGNSRKENRYVNKFSNIKRWWMDWYWT